jgi:hypothetical protein
MRRRVGVRSAPIPMVGKRYGDLLVIADAGKREYPTTTAQRLVRVRCDCGREYVTLAYHVRHGRSKRCLVCHGKWAARRGRSEQSVRLPDGRTVAEIAFAAGLDLGTVYRRFLRGWPLDKLGAPLRSGGGKGLGGAVDLPERRCTVFPERRAP